MKIKRQLWLEVPDDLDEIVLEHPSGEVQEVEVEHAEPLPKGQHREEND